MQCPPSLQVRTPSPPNPTHFIQSATVLPHLKQIHANLLCSGVALSTIFLSKLLSLPVSSATTLDYVLSVFLSIPSPTTRLSNLTLRALSRSGSGAPHRPLVAYSHMRHSGIAPDRFSLPPFLRAAATAGRGWVSDAHVLTAKTGLDSDTFVQTALVSVYSTLGHHAYARRVFDRMPQRDLVAWRVMLDGCYQTGRYNEALLLFCEMRVAPDPVILTTIVSACGRAGNVMLGKAVHSYIVGSGIGNDTLLKTALVNMYSSFGLMDTAQRLYDDLYEKNVVASTAILVGYAKIGKSGTARSIFDQIRDKDLVLWSAMISGYVDSDRANEALKLFEEMLASGMKPDQVTMLSVISACAGLGALDQARRIHKFVDENGFCSVMPISNGLIDMYSKCGDSVAARHIFDEMPRRNVITWTSMIAGLAIHGDGRSALQLFDQMKEDGIAPNGVTFVGLFNACSHAGLVEEGRRIFESMAQEHKIEPKVEHYGCMVDLLGRAKLLREALELIETMPCHPNVVVWGSLLGACRVYRDLELGEFAAKKLLELDPLHDGAYVLLSNIYATSIRWAEVGEVRRSMEHRGVLKEKGCSWIEWDGCIHEFMMGDKSHPMSREIYDKLDEVVGKVDLAGYAPDTMTVLVDVEEEEKREVVLLHSEKLALSFGLINSERGSSIRIVKNLRVCEDCHSFMKLVSDVFDREVVLRDRARFHHFKSGKCSCGEFW